jgi:hypothetical protein
VELQNTVSLTHKGRSPVFVRGESPPLYRHRATAYIAGIRRHRETARGCQNIMGFFDGADQGTKVKTRCTVKAARHGKQEDTLIMELPMVINNAQKPCGGCVVEFPHLFWQPRRCSLCRFTHYWCVV